MPNKTLISYKELKNAKTISIGFLREDGDFQLLVTFNNNDDLLPQSLFADVVCDLSHVLQNALGNERIQLLERQDSPDYVTLDNEE